MDYVSQIRKYVPKNKQEENDARIILKFVEENHKSALLRTNEIAHITSSGFVMNSKLNKVLLVHHNILDTWAWTGGHADGESDLLEVSIREAKEETGISDVYPLIDEIASADILPVPSHEKKGEYISAHLHLSIAYVLCCSEEQELKVKPDENSQVAWFGIDIFNEQNFSAVDVYLYNKLIYMARNYLRF